MIACPRCDKDHARGSSECPGRRVDTIVADKYRLERLLGVGGLGAVYEAEHLRLGTRVAVKILHARFAHQADVIARFHAEAKRAADLEHPGIVDVRDFGQDAEGIPYLELELLEGKSVGDLAREGPMPPERAVAIVAQALEALQAAHARGIVHRDLKPDNLFVTRDDAGALRVKILDFGLAKVVDDASALGLTQSGEVLGTILYASPEQLRSSRTVDPRADLWSMGATLFELVTGASPVAAVSLAEAVARITSGDVTRSVRSVRPELPDWLDAIVAKALRQDREARYESAAEMRADLIAERAPTDARIGDAETISPRATRSRRRSIAGALGLAGAIGVALFLVWPDPQVQRLDGVEPTTRRPATSEPVTEAPPPAPTPPEGMALVPGGAFSMGSSAEEIASAFANCNRWAKDCRVDAYQREALVRRVRVSPFFLDRTEVTHEAFARFLGGVDGARTQRGSDGHVRVHAGDVVLAALAPLRGRVPHYAEISTTYAVRPGFERRPVAGVTWDGARLFCESRGGSLPTEAQWEWAARSARNRRHPWGDGDPVCDGTNVGRFPRGPCADRPVGTSEVGLSTQDRSAQGVSELAGNVREWVRDSFVEPYPTCGAQCEDPVSEIEGLPDFRVVRGASWAAIPASARAAARSRYPRSEVFGDVGFRCTASVR